MTRQSSLTAKAVSSIGSQTSSAWEIFRLLYTCTLAEGISMDLMRHIISQPDDMAVASKQDLFCCDDRAWLLQMLQSLKVSTRCLCSFSCV